MNWTDEDLQKLKKLYATTPNPVLAKMFNRSTNAVYHKAFDLGVNKKKYITWSEKDTAKFIELYPNTKNKDLAKIFKRTEVALRTKAWEMGLKKSDKFMSEINKSPRSSHFQKGCIPWCKGLKLPSNHNREYQFKKGMIPHNKLPDELREVILEFRKAKKNLNEKIKRRQNK
jgi:hypothetical protein